MFKQPNLGSSIKGFLNICGQLTEISKSVPASRRRCLNSSALTSGTNSYATPCFLQTEAMKSAFNIEILAEG